MTRRKLVVVDEFNGASFDEGFLGVNHEVENGVYASKLVGGDGADGLFAHGTLVRVPWGLVVVGVGDQACDCAEDREGFDFKVGG